jgi:O-methyltransferase involved in polyketide biosynthesis
MNESVELTGVPETMLWTLHSRASEALRKGGVLDDAQAIAIYRSIDYDYHRSFGPAEPSMALRARSFDKCLLRFLEENPKCAIVNLGEGLETQRFRVSAPDAQWFSVDLPESMQVRERFIHADEQHQHIALSALDRRWCAAVPKNCPVFISAQGLFMYLPAAEVKSLLQDIAAQFDQVHLVFDTIPRWVSLASVAGKGLPRTLHYRTPPMPWGIDRFWIKPALRRWLGPAAKISVRTYPTFPRGPLRPVTAVATRIPLLRQWLPTIVEVDLP